MYYRNGLSSPVLTPLTTDSGSQYHISINSHSCHNRKQYHHFHFLVFVSGHVALNVVFRYIYKRFLNSITNELVSAIDYQWNRLLLRIACPWLSLRLLSPTPPHSLHLLDKPLPKLTNPFSSCKLRVEWRWTRNWSLHREIGFFGTQSISTYITNSFLLLTLKVVGKI